MSYEANMPQQIGKYHVRRPIGQGRMGQLLLCHDPQAGRPVVVKLLPEEMLETPGARERFQLEAHAILQLEHFAIVPVYDFGLAEDGRPYLVMRYMTQGSLRDKLAARTRPFTIAETVPIVERIAAALTAAHQYGFVHRDIKPDNILFDGYGQAYLADFGLAKLTTAAFNLTQKGVVVGTPAYASPEQLLGRPDVDQRADVYGLSVVLFQLWTGQLPYQTKSAYEMIALHLRAPIPSAVALNPALPPEADQLLAAGMAKEPADRVPTAVALVEQVKKLTQPRTPIPVHDNHSPPPKLITPLQGQSPPASSANWLWLGGALMGVTLLFFLVVSLISANAAPATPPAALLLAENLTAVASATADSQNGNRENETAEVIPLLAPEDAPPTTAITAPESQTGLVAEQEAVVEGVANIEVEVEEVVGEREGEGPQPTSTIMPVAADVLAESLPTPTPTAVVPPNELSLTTLSCPGPHLFTPGTPIQFSWVGVNSDAMPSGTGMQIQVGLAGTPLDNRERVFDATPDRPEEWVYRVDNVAQIASQSGDYEWRVVHIDLVGTILGTSERGCFTVVPVASP